MMQQLPGDVEIRNASGSDLTAILSLYDIALPQEDLTPLLSDLLAGRADVLSLVASAGAAIIGHLAFTSGRLDGCQKHVALLGPFAVLPAWQRNGIGRALFGVGLTKLRMWGQDRIERVLVLGDPGYYGRLGFATEPCIETPYPLIAEWQTAWQSLPLQDDAKPCQGQLVLPAPWMRPELWGAG